jgi:hypothetical protein
MTGDPTELDSFLLYERIARGIEAATDLRQMPDDLVGGRLNPSAILHRRFRVDPRQITFPKMRARAGDVVQIVETVAVLLHHDLHPDAPAASYQVAAQDFVAVLRALLTRTEICALGHPVGASRGVRRSSQAIEQEFVLAVTYYVSLPEEAGPGVPP